MSELIEEPLRQELWAAVAAGDQEHLNALCDENREAIFLAYPVWRALPPSQQGDLKVYGQSLAAIAKCFSTHLKDGRLFQLLLGVVDTNPLAAWENELQTARELLGKHDLYESAQELTGMLERNAGHSGKRADGLRAKTIGLLGEARFLVGQLEEARSHHLQALELSRAAGDEEGTLGHLLNLYNLDRYLGEPAAARRWVVELASLRPDEAQRWQVLTEDAELGPAVRLVAVAEGQEYELDDVPAALRRDARFIFRRNRPNLRLAQFYIDAGRRLSGLNYHARALECFLKAAEIDRYDPECRSLAGYLLLYLNRFDEAVKCYDEAERLGPGFYRLSTEAWTARELASHRMLVPAWQALVNMESGVSTPEEVLTFAVPVLKLLPTLAPLQYWSGQAFERTDRLEEAREAYRAAIQHAGEPNLRTRALLALSYLVQEPEKTDLLRHAAELKGHLPASATARWLLEAQTSPV